MQGYLEKWMRTPMAQGRSTKIIWIIKWIRISSLSMENSLSRWRDLENGRVQVDFVIEEGARGLDLHVERGLGRGSVLHDRALRSAGRDIGM